MNLIGANKFEDFSKEIFQLNSNIKYFALIDLEGRIVLENSKDLSSFVEDADRIMFYHQIGTRRLRREDFDESLGEVSYIHIQRKKTQQLIIYLPLVTIYFIINNKVKPNELVRLAVVVQKLDWEKLNQMVNSVVTNDNF